MDLFTPIQADFIINTDINIIKIKMESKKNFVFTYIRNLDLQIIYDKQI